MAKLVYLDDDRIQRLLMIKLVKIHLPHCTTEFFSEPEQLSVWLNENQVDLILSDLNFEGSNGWDWVTEFASKSAAPIVFVTANSTQEDRRKVSEFSNVKSVIEKPISEDNWQEISDLIDRMN